jgi:formylglycine-generating enzyme required for sulfatase activity/WD40 repeat protein
MLSFFRCSPLITLLSLAMLSAAPPPQADAVTKLQTHLDDPTPDDIVEIRFSQSRLNLLILRRNGHIEQWDTVTKTVKRSVDDTSKSYVGEVVSGAFSPSGALAAIIIRNDGEASTHLIQVNNGRRLGSLPETDGSYQDLAFSPDGRWLAAVTSEGSICLWETLDLRRSPIPVPTVLDRMPAAASHLAWSPIVPQPGDNESTSALLRLAVASTEGHLLMLLEARSADLNLPKPQTTRRIPFYFEGHPLHKKRLSWSSDAQYIAAAGALAASFTHFPYEEWKRLDSFSRSLTSIPFGILALEAGTGEIWRLVKDNPAQIENFAFSPQPGSSFLLLQKHDSDNFAALIDLQWRRQKRFHNFYRALSPAMTWHPSGSFAACAVGKEVAVIQPIHNSVVILKPSSSDSDELLEVSPQIRYQDLLNSILETRAKANQPEAEKSRLSSTPGILYIIAVGIDRYQQPEISLEACVSESELFASALQNAATPLFKEVHTQFLSNEQASSANIVSAVKKAQDNLHLANRQGKSAPENNVILFFYAGHGARVEGSLAANGGSPESREEQPEEFYLCPADYFADITSSQDLKKHALRSSKISELLEASNAAATSVIILSSCNAGGTLPWSHPGAQTNQAVFLGAEPFESVLEPTADLQKQFQLQPASLFGNALIEALSLERTDTNQDGVITIAEWQRMTMLRSAELHHTIMGRKPASMLYPVCFIRGHDFPIGVSRARQLTSPHPNLSLLPPPETAESARVSLRKRYDQWQSQRATADQKMEAARQKYIATNATNPFKNSLGQKLVYLPMPPASNSNESLLIATCETRIEDFSTFVETANYRPKSDVKPQKWQHYFDEKLVNSTLAKWNQHYFSQTSDEPVVCVSWNDVEAYHLWLTQRERQRGLIPTHAFYRLPRDHEWSAAAGIASLEDPSIAPSAMSDSPAFQTLAKQWPEPSSGNFHGNADKFAFTCHVESFKPNSLGLYHLFGNVEEMIDGSWEQATANPGAYHTLGRNFPLIRGGSFLDKFPAKPHESRDVSPIVRRSYYSWKEIGAPNLGFRSVLVIPNSPGNLPSSPNKME